MSLGLRHLNSGKIVETAAQLQRRIDERFPGSSLGKVASELHSIAQESIVRSAGFRRPYLVLRFSIGVLVAGIILILGTSIVHLRRTGEMDDLVNFVQFLEASLGSIVFIGAAILFLATVEARLKRRRALHAIHELRAIAHIVDMHQLTKDPDRIVNTGPATPSSPQRTMTPFQLCRYLDYCTELLSVTSKIGALYVQDFPDSEALAAVDQVEDLTTGLSGKIWQKIMILDQVIERDMPDVVLSGTSDVDRASGANPVTAVP